VQRPTRAIIDLNALKQNILALRGKLKPGTKFMAVVKANAYGHGSVRVSAAALECGVEYLGVATPEEGAALRETGIQAPILVLSGLYAGYADMIAKYRLTATVFSQDILLALQNAAEKAGILLPVHIKIDTGMNRIGVKTADELRSLLSVASDCANLRIEGMYTHFAVSEAADKSFTLLQASRFTELAKITAQAGLSPLLHASNSGAIITLPELDYDMVRAGISMYGYYPGKTDNSVQLTPVLTWKSAVSFVKTIEPGETVSYGRTFTAEKPMRIATLPLGYGDGFKRCLSNRAFILLRGKRAPVVGTVCMDQTMCDVTDIENVEPGDEAVLIGKQGSESIGADEMAKWADTISYEILLGISDRVPRVYT
jgi:alanine racemase